jgi:hypothetical protein
MTITLYDEFRKYQFRNKPEWAMKVPGWLKWCIDEDKVSEKGWWYDYFFF